MKDNKYPDGKISPDDEGEIAIYMAADHKNAVVQIKFPKPINWLGLPPDLARQFAKDILKKASEVDQSQSFVSWGIFYNPTDQPGKYVARKFKGTQATDECFVGDSLNEVRGPIPGIENLVIIPRVEGDPPNLVETWI